MVQEEFLKSVDLKKSADDKNHEILHSMQLPQDAFWMKSKGSNINEQIILSTCIHKNTQNYIRQKTQLLKFYKIQIFSASHCLNFKSKLHDANIR